MGKKIHLPKIELLSNVWRCILFFTDYKNGNYNEIKYDLESFTLKASVLNGKLADEITLLVPANSSVKSNGWTNDGKYKVKTVKLSETIEL